MNFWKQKIKKVNEAFSDIRHGSNNINQASNNNTVEIKNNKILLLFLFENSKAWGINLININTHEPSVSIVNRNATRFGKSAISPWHAAFLVSIVNIHVQHRFYTEICLLTPLECCQYPLSSISHTLLFYREAIAWRDVTFTANRTEAHWFVFD